MGQSGGASGGVPFQTSPEERSRQENNWSGVVNELARTTSPASRDLQQLAGILPKGDLGDLSLGPAFVPTVSDKPSHIESLANSMMMSRLNNPFAALGVPLGESILAPMDSLPPRSALNLGGGLQRIGSEGGAPMAQHVSDSGGMSGSQLAGMMATSATPLLAGVGTGLATIAGALGAADFFTTPGTARTGNAQDVLRAAQNEAAGEMTASGIIRGQVRTNPYQVLTDMGIGAFQWISGAFAPQQHHN